MKGRPTPRKVRQKRVPPTSQIGAVQNPLLEWLLTREEEISTTGTDHEKLVLEARGVPWNVKQFCRSCPKAYKVDGSPDSSKISTSLKQLEVKKRFVTCYGKRTSHVKLTEKGREQALAKRADPRTWQEKRAEATARRRADGIFFESAHFGDQMSQGKLYINLAREAYYLNQLWNMGRANPYEEKRLLFVLKQLRESTFNPSSLRILQHTSLSLEQAQEVRDVLDAVHG